MSLKTSPYTPAAAMDEPMSAVFDMREVVTFVYPNGSAQEIGVFEGMLLAAMYARRNAAAAMYHEMAGQRTLVLELVDGLVRTTPAMLTAFQKLLSVIEAECGAPRTQATAAATAAAEAPAAPEFPRGGAPHESAHATTRKADERGAAKDGAPAVGNRFRRNPQ